MPAVGGGRRLEGQQETRVRVLGTPARARGGRQPVQVARDAAAGAPHHAEQLQGAQAGGSIHTNRAAVGGSQLVR